MAQTMDMQTFYDNWPFRGLKWITARATIKDKPVKMHWHPTLGWTTWDTFSENEGRAASWVVTVKEFGE